MEPIQVIDLPISSLIPFANNARTHSKDQIAKIASSIKEFGFCDPIAIDAQNGVIAGHGRLEAAKLLGMMTVPTIMLSHLSKEQQRAYILAHNRIALDAGWDNELLSIELRELSAAGLDLSLTGLDDKELTRIMDLKLDENDTDATEDEIPVFAHEPITVFGDIWHLGDHRLVCGDSLAVTDIDKLIPDISIDMVFTDPPYGINENTDRVRSKRTQVAEAGQYEKIIGDDSTDTAIAAFNFCYGLGINVLVFWGANHYCSHLPDSANWAVWDKRVEDNERDSNSDCELAWVKSKYKSVRIFRHLWKGMIKGSEQGEKRCHPTQKPVALAIWAFDEYAPESKTILDLFGGSGSTLIACEKTNRKCYMMEISPSYCDVIIKRWEKFTVKKAILESNGSSFEEVANERKAGTGRTI